MSTLTVLPSAVSSWHRGLISPSKSSSIQYLRGGIFVHITPTFSGAHAAQRNGRPVEGRRSGTNYNNWLEMSRLQFFCAYSRAQLMATHSTAATVPKSSRDANVGSISVLKSKNSQRQKTEMKIPELILSMPKNEDATS